jgi:hypothetical protein
MSTGAGDSVDLGWKIEAVLRGWGGEGLLDSYEAERHPVAVRNTAAAADNFKPWRLQLDYAHIDEDSAQGEQDRRVIGDALTAAFKPEWETWGTTMGYRYEGSPICVPDGTPAYADHCMIYEQTSRPGSRAPHAWLDDGRSTIDLFGRGFVLLRFMDAGEPVAALERAARAASLPLQVVDIDRADIAALYERKLVLVRPDGHVSWRGDRLPLDVETIVATIRGARTQHADKGSPAPLVFPEAAAQG